MITFYVYNNFEGLLIDEYKARQLKGHQPIQYTSCMLQKSLGGLILFSFSIEKTY